MKADIKAGYGLTIILDHGYGIETWYGHLRKSLVRKGMKVGKGTQLALMGSSGRSTGPHVHYEVRVNGTPVDPRTFILEADPA
jgi:murein DD-endopeptidase MepM/ murein hydrolase activator NlpD